MATIRILLGIICLVSTLGNRLPSGSFLRAKVETEVENEVKVNSVLRCSFFVGNNFRLSTHDSRLKLDSRLWTFDSRLLKLYSRLWTPASRLWTLDSRLLKFAQSQIGVREATGKNDGLAVEAYLHYTGNQKGEPWCASFVSWVFGKADLTMPRTAWSPALFPKNRQTLIPLPADVFGIYFEKYQRIAHCGLVESAKGSWIYTIEGNTNGAGSREGDGVFRKLRHRRTIAVYANWLNQLKKGVLK